MIQDCARSTLPSSNIDHHNKAKKIPEPRPGIFFEMWVILDSNQ
jgi:hypothetical protein